MKHLNELINEGMENAIFEGIFNIDKNLTPFEIAEALKDYQYNTTDGGKDCFGQPLKEGDLILVANKENIGKVQMTLGVYVSKKGMYCEFWLASPNLGETEEDSIMYIQRCFCNKVF